MSLKHPLRAYREARNLTLDELAGELGVKRNTVWRWEGGRLPDKSKWPIIAKVTGIRPEDLVRFAGMETAS